MANIPNIQKELDEKTEGILSDYGLPNIASVIVYDNAGTVLHCVRGVKDSSKQAGASGNKMEAADYFNVGSISKPITGFFIACLIKQKVLKWETRIRDVFPEIASPDFRRSCGLNENFPDTTVAQLMDHTSGMNGQYYFVENDYSQSVRDTDPFRFIQDAGLTNGGNSRDPEWKNDAALIYQRYLYMILSLKKSRYAFHSNTNLGYNNKGGSGYGSTCTICAAMAERILNKTWEKIMYEIMLNYTPMQMTFGKLMNGAQFHYYDAGTKKYVVNESMANDLVNYSSKFMTGGIHCTVSGIAQYIRYNLPALDYSAVFDVNEYHKVTTGAAQGGLYRHGSGNNVYFEHNGDTGSSRAEVRIYPALGYGYAVMSNSGGGPENRTTADALSELKSELGTIAKNWETY